MGEIHDIEKRYQNVNQFGSFSAREEFRVHAFNDVGRLLFLVRELRDKIEKLKREKQG